MLPARGGKDASAADRLVRARLGTGTAHGRGRASRRRAGVGALRARGPARRTARVAHRRQSLTGGARGGGLNPRFLLGASDDYFYGPSEYPSPGGCGGAAPPRGKEEPFDGAA